MPTASAIISYNRLIILVEIGIIFALGIEAKRPPPPFPSSKVPSPTLTRAPPPGPKSPPPLARNQPQNKASPPSSPAPRRSPHGWPPSPLPPRSPPSPRPPNPPTAKPPPPRPQPPGIVEPQPAYTMPAAPPPSPVYGSLPYVPNAQPPLPPPLPPPWPGPTVPLLPLPPSPVLSPTARGAVRLVRGTASIGRLEVATRDQWFTGFNGGVTWLPVCDSYSFTQVYAQLFCQLLGYEYGRKYYEDGISSYGNREPNPRWPVGNLRCSLSSDERRRGLQTSLASGAINFRPGTKYACSFTEGLCGLAGTLVALECSGVSFPPGPPPPPTPPAIPLRPDPPMPPPSRPAWPSLLQGTIRLNGGGMYVEPNLCPEDDMPCRLLTSRVELRVTPSEGRSPVWAPLCYDDATADPDQRWTIAKVVCEQAGESKPGQLGRPDVPLFMPEGPVEGEGNFDPSHYSFWVTIAGGVDEEVRSLDELVLEVKTVPCYTGYLFSVVCD